MSRESATCEAYLGVPHNGMALTCSGIDISGYRYPTVLFATELFGPQPYPVFYEMLLGQQLVCSCCTG